MNWTDKLQEILTWIASHGNRLSRAGFKAPNHLSNATVHFFEADSTVPASTYADDQYTAVNPHPIVLDSDGKTPLQIFLKPAGSWRMQVHDNADEILFTQDHIAS